MDCECMIAKDCPCHGRRAIVAALEEVRDTLWDELHAGDLNPQETAYQVITRAIDKHRPKSD